MGTILQSAGLSDRAQFVALETRHPSHPLTGSLAGTARMFFYRTRLPLRRCSCIPPVAMQHIHWMMHL